jgi:hypothetical protein
MFWTTDQHCTAMYSPAGKGAEELKKLLLLGVDVDALLSVMLVSAGGVTCMCDV